MLYPEGCCRGTQYIFLYLAILQLATAAVQVLLRHLAAAEAGCGFGHEGGYLKLFRLYGTSACHLCELALDMIKAQQLLTGSFDFEEVDIVTSEALCERYGVLIPVLQHPDQRELKWPFGPQQLRNFLAS